MTDANKTLIAALLDRSGSMSLIKTDTEGGFNNLIAEQRKQPGEVLVTLMQFDDIYETVYSNKPIGEVPSLVLAPRSMTALLDSIGKGISDIGTGLAALPEDERPGTVIFLIMTDGMENASREWTLESVKAKVTEQQQKFGWEFIFLGANMDAVEVAKGMGISLDSALTYSASSAGVTNTVAAASTYITRTRGGERAAFTDADRSAAQKN
jgi:hypothetical protein